MKRWSILNRLRWVVWVGLLAILCCIPTRVLFAAERAPSNVTPAAALKLYLPGLVTPGKAQPQPQPQPGGSLPATLVGTWFAGNLLPYDFYNPDTGQWSGTNGLGQMYVFTENGDYTYTAFFRSQYGQCTGEVSVYKQGTARVQGADLVLKPTASKTRTVTACGSHDDSTVDGPLVAVSIGWALGYDNGGRRQLRITDGELVTDYSKQGMAPELVGGWTRGGVASAGFYDAQTKTFATPEGDGGWFRFNADGSYTMGEYGHATDAQGCGLTGWLYQEGTLSVSGGTLTTLPSAGMSRVESDCQPGQAQQQPWVDEARTYSWSFWDRATAPKLVLIPLERYQEFVFTPE
jgi:hypothetical protein